MDHEESLKVIGEIMKKVFVNELGENKDTLLDELEKRTRFCINNVNGRPVGTGILKHSHEYTASISDICVLSDFRNKGYGKQIVKELEKTATNMGYKEIELIIPLDKVSIFTKLGYHVKHNKLSETGIIPVYMTKKLDVWSYLRKQYKLELEV